MLSRLQMCKKNFFVFSVLLIGLQLNTSLVYSGGGKYVKGAKKYIKENKLDEALDVLMKEINDGDPENEDAWYLLGYVHARKKNYQKMVEAFNKAVTLKPKFQELGKGVKVSKDTGRKFLSQYGTEMIKGMIWTDLFNGAVTVFNDALSAVEDTARIEYFKKAANKFEASTIVRPDSLMGYRNWAAALMNIGKYEDCILPLKEAMKRAPQDVDIRTLLAQVYMVSSNVNEAIPLLEDLWTQGHQSAEVADQLSRAYLSADSTEKAKTIYKEAITIDPDNFSFRFSYGTLLLQANEYDAAIEQLKAAHALNSETSEVNYNLGAAFLNRGVAKYKALPENSEDISYKEDFKFALPYLEKAILFNPDDQIYWTALGQIAGQLNMISLAGYAFSRAEPTRSAFGEKVVVGMPSATLKSIFGDPNKRKNLESEQFSSIEEWIYHQRRKSKKRVAVPKPINIYIEGGKVVAMMLEEN
ncbi:MAG: tetratricopeptide repeat protein [bacterium]